MNINTSSSFRYEYFICLFLTVSTLLIYWPVKDFDFINYDDPLYTTGNNQVQKGLTWESIVYAFTQSTEKANYWIPLVWLTHIIDYELAGLNPGRFHLTNLFFHIINVILLFAVCCKLTGAIWRSGFVAALFALHPIHVESVAWVSERKDLVSTFFWFLTILAYIKYVEHPTKKRFLFVISIFILGLMSKPMLVTLPFVLLLLDYWPLSRFTFSPSVDKNIKIVHKPFAKLVIEKAPLFALLPLVSFATWHFQKIGGSVASIKAYPLDLRLANVVVSYVKYIKKLFIPTNLAIPYPFPQAIPSCQWFLAICLLIGVSFLTLWCAKRLPYLLTGWFWFLGVLFPVSGIIVIGDYAMADRYAYLSFIGLYLIVVWGAGDLLKSLTSRIKLAVFVLFALFAAIIVMTTRIQIGYWENSVALYKHTIQITGENYHAFRNLGSALAKRGEFAEAITYHQKALQMNPQSVTDINNLANNCLEVGKPEMAFNLYKKALTLEPESERTHYNLGLALSEQGRSEEALKHHYSVLRLNPSNVSAMFNLGNDLNQLGRTDAAITQYLKVLKLNAKNAEAWYNLGNAMIKKKIPNKAIEFFHQALKHNPQYAEAYNNLGVVLSSKGENDKAIACFKKALQSDSTYTEASNNLRLLLELTKADNPDAVFQ